MQKKYIMSLDQGTTSCRTILFDINSNTIAVSQKEITQIYPKSGWVEHNPMEIWGTQSGLCKEILETNGIHPEEIAAIGITNQRETTVLWDKITGKPVYNAIVWQSRQTSEICDQLKKDGLQPLIGQKTGLVIDAYFSATKIKWILDNIDGVKEKAQKGEILFGTIDTWLIWNLTRGKIHVTDYSNASRTMLFDINKLQWDTELLTYLDIPECILPQVKPSSEIYGYTHESIFEGTKIPISGIAGDQQAALFGQGCFESGTAKSTYGTGCFILMNTGVDIFKSPNGLLTTIAWGIDGKVEYALEGGIFNAGSSIQWLRDELQIIHDSKDSEYFASKVSDSNGIYVVPAFTGLGAPYWDMYSRGLIIGLTRGVNRSHIIRATLESIAYQVKDIIQLIKQESGIGLKMLKVDGGASENNFLMQFQSDILGVNVIRPHTTEVTALGSAYLAGLAVGFWDNKFSISKNIQPDKVFFPNFNNNKSSTLYNGWKKAVSKSLNWIENSVESSQNDISMQM